MLDILNNAPGLYLSFAILFFGLISPGPSVAAIFGVSVANSRMAALAFALGVATGTTILAIAAVTGVSGIIAKNIYLLYVMKFVGGAYFIWLGFRQLKALKRPSKDIFGGRALPNKNILAFYGQGMLIHLTNPKALFVWLAIVAIGLPAQAPFEVAATLVVGSAAMSATINGGYAFIFTIALARAFYRRIAKTINAILGGVFIFAGLQLIFSRIGVISAR